MTFMFGDVLRRMAALAGLVAGACFVCQASSLTQIDISIPNWPAGSGQNPTPLTLTSSASTFSAFPAVYLSAPLTSVDIHAYSNADASIYADVAFVGPTIAGNTPGLLLPGTYTNFARWPFVSVGQAGFDLDIDFFGEDNYSGEFTILEAEWNPDGSIAHFGATFDVVGTYPNNGSTTFIGDVFYNYDPATTSAPEPATMLPSSFLIALGIAWKLRAKRSGVSDRS
jgi:hypothetical protein